MDPYVVIKVGNEQKKTKPHYKGSKNPVWKDKEAFNFSTNDWWTENIILEVFEVDKMGSDDKVGAWQGKLKGQSLSS